MNVYYVNGLVFPEGYRAVAFKQAEQDKIYEIENILQIRYRVPSADYIYNNVIVPNIGNLSIQTGYGLYDDDYPTEEGYFWYRNRTTNINGFSFTSYSLKQRLGFISVRFAPGYSFNIPNNPKAVCFANEDYILIFMEHDANVNDFIAALSNPILPPTVFAGATLSSAPPIFTFTHNNPSVFTTFLYIPDWRGESKTISDTLFIETRDYYYYYIDFASYMQELTRRMSSLLRVPVKHRSEYMNLHQQYPAFIVYSIEYQDKHEIAIYRKLGPWATHFWVSAKVNFEFHFSDFLLYRGFMIDFGWQERITNEIPSVRVFGPGTNASNAKGYYATIKWSLPEMDWSVMHNIDDVSSSKNYFNYQYDFSAEIYYFWIRPEKRANIIELIRAVYSEPHSIDCTTIRKIATNVLWTRSGINIVPDPSQTTPFNTETIT